MFLQILFGIIFLAFGVSCVRWNYTVANNLREFGFIEKMGGGDVYNGTKLLGIICIFLGFATMFGLFNLAVGSFDSRNFGDGQ